MAKQKKTKIPRELCFDYPLTWFTDPTHIPNQQLVQATIQWFETGAGSRAFTTLEFLNLLYKQRQFVMENIYTPDSVKNHFDNLPLSTLEKHILTGFILKWTGGYPVHCPDREQEKTLKVIEAIFLHDEPDSPEHTFCLADMNQRKQFMKLGIALTTAINHGLDAATLLTDMDQAEHDKQYEQFEDLFSAATIMGALGPFKNEIQYQAAKSRHEFGFNSWLLDFKGWLLGDEEAYKPHLNRSTFIEYLRYDREQGLLRTNQFNAQKILWSLDDPEPSCIDSESEPIPPSPQQQAVRKHLLPFHPLFQSEQEFERAVVTLSEFLVDRQYKDVQEVFMRKKSVKTLSFALGEIWRNSYNEVIPFSYLNLCKQLFSVLSKYDIQETGYKGSNLYKYFISPV